MNLIDMGTVELALLGRDLPRELREVRTTDWASRDGKMLSTHEVQWTYRKSLFRRRAAHVTGVILRWEGMTKVIHTLPADIKPNYTFKYVAHMEST